MRQADGRPRGFGYVTLDSVAAADRCLATPQVVDGRVVDIKRAVPPGADGGAAGASSLWGGGANGSSSRAKRYSGTPPP